MNQPPHARQTVLIAVNPKAGSGKGVTLVEEIVRRLESSGFQVIASQQPDEIVHRARQLASVGGCRCVLTVGGDGTASLFAERLPIGTAIVIVPLGTENLLAKEFGFTTDPADIWQTVTENQVWRMDAGEANGKLFLIMATAGFDAEVTRVLAEVRKGHIRHWSYAKPILSVVRSYSYPPIRVRGANPVRGTDQEVEAAWAMAFNVPRYAMGIPFCPRAVVDDGELDFCLLHRPGLVAGLGYLLKILLRRSGSVSRTTTGRSAELHWESPTTTPIPFQLDGDFVGYLPVSLSVRQKRVTMLRPSRSATRQEVAERLRHKQPGNENGK